jgi:hypothetical protein
LITLTNGVNQRLRTGLRSSSMIPGVSLIHQGLWGTV